MTLAYLATPYTKYPAGPKSAHAAAASVAAKLITTGMAVFSPIAHAHPIALQGGFDLFDATLWAPLYQRMLAHCDVLIVAHLPSWENSKGVAEEIKFFERAAKPIFDLDPESLKMVRR